MYPKPVVIINLNSFIDTCNNQPYIDTTVEPLYFGHPWDKYKCPDYKGVLISGLNLYYKAQFGTSVSVLNTGVSSFQGVLNRGVSLYTYKSCTD